MILTNSMQALKPILERSILEIWLLPSLSVLAAFAAAVAAIFSYKLSKAVYSVGIQKLFFDILFQLPHIDDKKPLTLRQLELVCNYFEFVSYLYFQRKLNMSDMYLLSEVMKQKDYVDYAKKYQKIYGKEKFKYYVQYLDSYILVKTKVKVDSRTIFYQKEIMLFILSGLFLVLGFLLVYPYRLISFLLAGVFSGVFYGKHNHEVWPGKRKYVPEPIEKLYFYWVHLLGSIIGGACLYLLSNRFFISSTQFSPVGSLGLEELMLFIVVVLGYFGYIPRILWFLANRGGKDLRPNL